MSVRRSRIAICLSNSSDCRSKHSASATSRMSSANKSADSPSSSLAHSATGMSFSARRRFSSVNHGLAQHSPNPSRVQRQSRAQETACNGVKQAAAAAELVKIPSTKADQAKASRRSCTLHRFYRQPQSIGRVGSGIPQSEVSVMMCACPTVYVSSGVVSI